MSADDDREDHRRRADDGRADEHRLGRRLECVAGSVVLLEEVLGLLEVGVEAELALDLLADARDLLDRRQFEHRLGVVRHRTVRIDRDRHRTHAEEPERHETEREHRRRDHQRAEARTCSTTYAIAISAMIAMPIQNALKLPATRPDRMFSDAPPSRDDVTTSRTCVDSVDVKTFTNSGMIAPASVPQVMTVDSFHHSVPSPKVGIEQVRDDDT